MNASINDISERITGAVKNNPEGLLLLAAGCALLMRHGLPSRANASIAEVSETARDYAASARDYAAGVADQVGRTAASGVESVAAAVEDRAGRVTEDYPWAVAIAGLAAGAAAGALFPVTDVERRTLGPAGARLADVADKAGDRLKQAAAKVGETVVAAADESGVNAGAAKDLATEVGDAFVNTLTGETDTGAGKTRVDRSGK